MGGRLGGFSNRRQHPVAGKPGTGREGGPAGQPAAGIRTRPGLRRLLGPLLAAFWVKVWKELEANAVRGTSQILRAAPGAAWDLSGRCWDAVMGRLGGGSGWAVSHAGIWPNYDSSTASSTTRGWASSTRTGSTWRRFTSKSKPCGRASQPSEPRPGLPGDPRTGSRLGSSSHPATRVRPGRDRRTRLRQDDAPSTRAPDLRQQPPVSLPHAGSGPVLRRSEEDRQVAGGRERPHAPGGAWISSRAGPPDGGHRESARKAGWRKPCTRKCAALGRAGRMADPELRSKVATWLDEVVNSEEWRGNVSIVSARPAGYQTAT